MPRWTSPIASRNTLPCSSLITVASAFWLRSTSSRNRVRTRARRTGGVVRHVGNAAVAAATAASTSAVFANGTTRTTLPVAGLVTSPNRTLCVAVGRPLIQRGTEASADGADVGIVVLMFKGLPGPKGPGLHGRTRPTGRRGRDPRWCRVRPDRPDRLDRHDQQAASGTRCDTG